MNEPSQPDLPNEILSIIVELAASKSAKTCYNLSLVCHSFHTWTAPILYNRLDGLKPRTAQAFLPLVLQKPPNYFSRKTHVKSISFAEAIPMPVARAILAQCSQRLISYSSRSTDKEAHPGRYLPLVKSPFLRRLSLVWIPQHDVIPKNPFEGSWRGNYLTGISSPYNCIAYKLFSSVSHFIAYTPLVPSSENRYLTWSNLSRAVDRQEPFYSSFQKLTHVAMSIQNLDFVRDLLVVSPNIRYVAFLHHENVESWLVSRVRWELEDRMQGNRLFGGSGRKRVRWRRRYVVMNANKIGEVNLVDSGEQALFWQQVERLVDNGFCSDSGCRWKDLPSASSHLSHDCLSIALRH